MSKIKIQGDGGGMGTFTIISPNTDSNNTITLPDASGTLLTSSQDLVPSQNEVFNLGSPTKKWKDLYLSGSTINIGGISISASPSGIVLPELTIGTGTSAVKLAASDDGKLEQTGTSSTGAAVPTVNVPQVLNDLSDVDLTTPATNNQILGFIEHDFGSISTVTINNNVASVGYHLTVDNFNDPISTLPDARPAGDYLGVTGTSSGSGTVGTFDISVYDQSASPVNGAIVAAPYNMDADNFDAGMPTPRYDNPIGTHNTSFTITSTGGMVTDGAAPGLLMTKLLILPQHYTTSGSGTGAWFKMSIWEYDGAGNAFGNANFDESANGFGQYQMFFYIDNVEATAPPRAQTYSNGGSGYAAGDTITIYGTNNHPSGAAASVLYSLGTSSGPDGVTTGTFDATQDITFTINANGIYSDSTNITNVSIVSQGSGHSVGDIITIADADLGGGGAADFTMQVATIDGRQPATYTGVAGNSSASGTAGTFDVIIDSSGNITSVTPNNDGDGNFVGDVISISDAVLGNGGSPDLSLNVATIEPKGVFTAKDSILEFSDFADVDTVTIPPTDKQVLAWDNTNNNWTPSPNAMPWVVATTTELIALTNLSPGHKALVTELNRIYMYTGSNPNSNWRHAVSGWYAIADISMSNAKPVDVTGVDPTYVLDDLGKSIVVTTAAVDPEQMPLTWSWAVTTGSKTDNTTVVQRDIVTPTDTSNEFTITPGIYPSDTSSFSITFSVSDDSLDTTDAIGAFTLDIPLPDWKYNIHSNVNANWHSEISNLDFSAADSNSMNGVSSAFFGQSVDIDARGDTIIVSDPYYARPYADIWYNSAPTTGISENGAIHIYNKTVTGGISTWTKNNQILFDPIDSSAHAPNTTSIITGSDGRRVDYLNVGGFSGDRGAGDPLHIGNQIALSSNGKNIIALKGNGAHTSVATFYFDNSTNTYVAGDYLIPTDESGQFSGVSAASGIYLGNPAGTVGQNDPSASESDQSYKDTVILGPLPKIAISADGNTCILGYGMEGAKGSLWTYTDPRTTHYDSTLTFPLFGPASSAGVGKVTAVTHADTNTRNTGSYVGNTGITNGDGDNEAQFVFSVNQSGSITVNDPPENNLRVYSYGGGAFGSGEGLGHNRHDGGSGYRVGDIINIKVSGQPDIIATVSAIGDAEIPKAGGVVSDFIDVEVISYTDGAGVTQYAALDDGHVNFGAMYIFEKTGTGTNTGTPLWNSTNSEWGLTKKITGVNIVDTLGAAVDLSDDGTVAIASAPRGTADINDLTTSAIGGYVTVFDSTTTAGTWTQVATLRPPTNIIDNSGDAAYQHKYFDNFGAPDILRTPGVYTNVQPRSSQGVTPPPGFGNDTSGRVAYPGLFNIVVSSDGAVTSVIPVTLGSGNLSGDDLVFSDADLGGGGAADFTMTITNLTGINAQHKRSHFGDNSISISGDGRTIAVGDSGSAIENSLANSSTLSSHPFSAGAVHIYTKNSMATPMTDTGTWTYKETVFSPNGSSQDGFGNSVDLNLNGHILTVGAINEGSEKYSYDDGEVFTNSGNIAGPFFLDHTVDNADKTAVDKTGAVYVFNYDHRVYGPWNGRYWEMTRRETILPYEQSAAGSLMGRPKVSSDGKIIVSGHKSLETNNNSGRVEIWTENEANTLGDITGLDSNYTLNNDGTSTAITVTVDEPVGNEIWWSFETSNFKPWTGFTYAENGAIADRISTNGVVTEKRHATPFDISKSQTDEISEFSSGNWTPVDNSTMNNFSPYTALGKHMTMSNFSSADVNRTAGTYTGVTGTSSGNGTVGTFDILVDSTGDITSVTVVTQGSGHTVNDTITIVDADLGAGGAADFTMQVATIDVRTAGTYTGVTGTSSGTGTVGTFDITIDSSGTATDVTVVTLGAGIQVTTTNTSGHIANHQGHVIGDTITISDADLGAGGAADFTMDIATISDIAIVRRLFGNTNRPRSFKMESLDNVGTANPITTDFDYVALNTTAGFTNPTGTGPENTFIITPNSDITLGGSFDLTITATDGVNTKTATTTLTLPV